MKFEKVNNNRYLLDARGYACPYPQVFTLKAIKELKEGSIMEVLVDNPASCDNVPAAVRKLGHEVLEVRQESNYWRIIIRKR
ncbi:sulfurtransferase TusA family protein [Vulcanisaeta distributa]|uniref:SirA family protein n=1 Tax=Vulcanisaeta distributa (strain DSM 14429 / JCM 11212 / NBRC 100878 / IC-017) TaxID=572478 RepID=E1QRC9_VULDI|nr:sulfurtransferase TusA family protein [Vulcanisaeta distributa]ADN50626.1 SirA family protein [Vulcanisaeta distributa DSM 14429]